MLTVNPALLGLLWCLVIGRNSVVCLESSDISKTTASQEVVSASSIDDALEVVQPPVTSIKTGNLEETTFFKQDNNIQHSENSTVVAVTENNKEDNNDDEYSTTMMGTPSSVITESLEPKIMDFRPSVHLGEIHDEYQSRKSITNPFNNANQVKFENPVRMDARDTGRVRGPEMSSLLSSSSLSSSSSSPSSSSAIRSSARAVAVAGRKKNHVKFFETDSRYGVAVPIEFVNQHQHEQQEFFNPLTHQHQQELQQNNNDGEDNSDNNNYTNDNHQHSLPVGHESGLMMAFEYPRSQYSGVVAAKPLTLGKQVLHPSTLSDEQQVHLQQYEPGLANVHTIYVKPSKFHGEVEIVTPLPVVQYQHYEYSAPASGEAMEKPEVNHFHQLHHHHHPQGSYHEAVAQDTNAESIGKPETVLYLTSHRETAFTRTRKFPYKFYHPSVGHQDTGEYHFVQDVNHAFPPKETRISPWKKIIHLIGTFLPLGLLLASLKPNVVKIESTTQPNIVLSKLRAADLPAEHKDEGFVKEDDYFDPSVCEDRSICELIVSGSKPRANLLQHILWNFTSRSTDEEAKKHGLHEIFAAVKRKDCSTIDC